MAKRKAAVNEIIYELDNDDITLSSDEEIRQPKINRTQLNNGSIVLQSYSASQDSAADVIDIDSSLDIINCDAPSPPIENGGKSLDSIVVIENDSCKGSPDPELSVIEEIVEKKPETVGSKTTIFHEDIDIDSPGNSDLGVVGCENRTPLITVRFRDKKLAMSYKKKLKSFMLSLIKLHENEDFDSDNDTDLELDIWPEDFVEDIVEPENNDSNFFFVDTAPCEEMEFIPAYNSLKDESLISNAPEIPVPSPAYVRRGPTCFNCDGDHPLRDCKKPKNFTRINEMRSKRLSKKTERYHMEDDQRFGHMVPGRVSGRLRDALGLKRYELPLHTYRMRHLGYPPAWLEEARISHSGISLFDSSGRATLEPDEEEGEVSEPGSKDKFDIKKIWDFPGFNVPASKRYLDESQFLSLPPMSEKDSKLTMLQILAPNAMIAYKRKKLTYFPSAGGDTSQGGQAEMEIDSGDEALDFPSAPPLPDEAPQPPPPPPPPLPPGPPPDAPGTGAKDTTTIEDIPVPLSKLPKTINANEDTDSIGDIPIPFSDLIVLDEEGETSEPCSGRTSPSLDDLEVKKRLLLDALSTEISQDTEGKAVSVDNGNTSITVENDKSELNSDKDTKNDKDVTITDNLIEQTKNTDEVKPDTMTEEPSSDNAEIINDSQVTVASSTNTQTDTVDVDKLEVTKTPEPKLKTLRTEYGTPIMSSVSPYANLPTNSKFAKDICDVLYFENLPNSIGKYKQISSLLKKVKDQVDMIQDS